MPTLLMIIAMMFWSASFIFIKLALQEMHPILFVFYRFSMASLLMLPGLALLKTPLKRQDIVGGAKLGLLMAGMMLFQTIGLQTITASLSAFLTGFSIVFFLVIKFLMQRKLPGLVDLLTSLMCLAGLGLITRSQGLSWEAGVLYTLASAFFH